MVRILIFLFVVLSISINAQGLRDSLTSAILRDRASTETWLRTSSSSYLATIHRVDFGDREILTLGRADDCDVQIVDSTVSDHHLRVTVVKDSFLVETIDPGVIFTAQGPQRRRMLPPSSIGVGRFNVRLSHQRFPGIIVFDAVSPRFKEYKGLKYFPIDLSYRYVLPLIPNPYRDTVTILSTRGNRRNALKLGWFEFVVEGIASRLEAHRLLEPGVGETSTSIFFRDKTSGKESYELGRYVEAELLPDGRYVLDFNRAYNPACAFSTHYNCPIPTKDNTLPVAIRAGEMDSHYMKHD